MEIRDLIKKECAGAGFGVAEFAAENLRVYIEELISWNKKVNLTAIKSEKEILSRLIIPALSFSTMLPMESKNKILDFGSGAGFPGVPLKIVFPNQEITLIDSIGKKVKFLRHISEKLELKRVRCINDRGETFVKGEAERGQYDFVLAMAVSDLLSLKKYAFPFLKPGGELVTLKGDKLASETEEFQRKTRNREYEIKETREFTPANCTPYKLISIKKCST